MSKDLMNKLYKTIFENQPSFEESCRKTDNAVREIEDSYSGTLQKEQIELLSDKFMGIVSDARHDGFEAGVRFSFKLLMELLLDD